MNQHAQPFIIIVHKVGSGESNPGPHDCNVNALKTESSPQLWTFSRCAIFNNDFKILFFPMISHPI